MSFVGNAAFATTTYKR